MGEAGNGGETSHGSAGGEGSTSGRGAASRGPAISAHQGGGEYGPGGTYEAYRAAVAAGAEYVEFDVRLTADGTLVACHRARARRGHPVAALPYPRLNTLAGYEVPRVADVMRLLAGRAVAHLDLKDARCAEVLAQLAQELLGPGGAVVTTGAVAVVSSLKRRFPAVRAGLTLGGDVPDTVRYSLRWARTPGLTRPGLAAMAGADFAVLHHRVARPQVLAECHRRGIKTIVWTVNSDAGLARWLASPGVDVLVTDRPGRALALRGHPGAGTAQG